MVSPRRMSASALVPLLLFGAMCVPMAFALCMSLPPVVEWTRLGSYVATPGTFRASDIQVGAGDAGGAHRSGGSAPSFMPVVWYDYAVNGQAFTGNRIRMMPVQTQSWAEAQRVIAAFGGPPSPPSTSLTVWYDPSHPERSLLLREGNGGVLTLPVLLLAIMGVFGLVIVYARRARLKRRAAHAAVVA